MCGSGIAGRSLQRLRFDFESSLVGAGGGAVVVGVFVAAVAAAVAAASAVVVIVLLEFVVGSGYFRRREKFSRMKMRLEVAAAVVQDLGVVRYLGGFFFSSSCSYWSLPLRPAPIPNVL